MITASEFKGTHPIKYLAENYPQLYLPVKTGMKDSAIYKNIIQRGDRYQEENLNFSLSLKDTLKFYNTPVGDVPILYFHERKDFIRFIRIMYYGCEPVDLPDSMGAVMITGIINWNTIRKHRKEYESAGNSDWAQEFRRFTGNKSNYTDTILVVNRGGYSGLDYKETKYSPEEWEAISLNIRIYHELTHFVYRKLHPGVKVPVLDEIIADSTGLLYGLGKYDSDLAKKFLGIHKDYYEKGKRLENYLKDFDGIETAMAEANRIIDWLSDGINGYLIREDNFAGVIDFLYDLVKAKELKKEQVHVD